MASPTLLAMNSTSEFGWRTLPPIISEALVHKFTYWNHQIQAGMRYGIELYALLQSYPITDRLKACDIACEYQSKGADVCITASKATYSVWLNLRSLDTMPQDGTDQIMNGHKRTSGDFN